MHWANAQGQCRCRRAPENQRNGKGAYVRASAHTRAGVKRRAWAQAREGRAGSKLADRSDAHSDGAGVLRLPLRYTRTSLSLGRCAGRRGSRRWWRGATSPRRLSRSWSGSSRRARRRPGGPRSAKSREERAWSHQFSSFTISHKLNPILMPLSCTVGMETRLDRSRRGWSKPGG